MTTTSISITVRSKVNGGCSARILYKADGASTLSTSSVMYIPGDASTDVVIVLTDADKDVPYTLEIRSGAGDSSSITLLNKTHAFTESNKLEVTVGGWTAWDVASVVASGLFLIMFLLIVVLLVRQAYATPKSSASTHAKSGKKKSLAKARASAYPAVFKS